MANIPELGQVRFRWTKDLPVGKGADKSNKITGARLVKDALGWHIAFRVQPQEQTPAAHPDPEVGIDAGITIPLALADTYGTVVVEALSITNLTRSARGTVERPDRHHREDRGPPLLPKEALKFDHGAGHGGHVHAASEAPRRHGGGSRGRAGRPGRRALRPGHAADARRARRRGRDQGHGRAGWLLVNRMERTP